MNARRLPHPSWPAALVMAALSLAAPRARAQGTGRSLDFDPSIRASGMGGASNAVFWDQATNDSRNPALLGYQHGLAYEYGKTQLVPGLAADVRLTSNVLKLGGGGLGLAFSGKPFGLGGIHLSYGESEGTDPSGNPTGTFEAFEQVDTWSFGVSAARAAEAIRVMSGNEPKDWSRYGDVSIGMTSKHLEMNLGPLGQGETDAHDVGYLVRLSPTELLPAIRDVVGLDLSYGWSDLSYDGDPILFPGETEPSEISEHERRGYAGRLRAGWPDMATQMAGPAWIWEGLQPLVSFGYANDHADIGTSTSKYETDGDGWELTVANIFSMRRGHYEDLFDNIAGDTEGWSVGIPIGHLGGARYDFARFPESRDSGLPDLERRGMSAWVDVMKVWRMSR